MTGRTQENSFRVTRFAFYANPHRKPGRQARFAVATSFALHQTSVMVGITMKVLDLSAVGEGRQIVTSEVVDVDVFPESYFGGR